MEDRGDAPAAQSPSPWRALAWAVALGGGGVLLLGVLLFAGFAVVLLLIRLFLGVLGRPVSLHHLYVAGGDTALHGLLGGHLALLGGTAVVVVLVSCGVLALLRRWEEVRGWWPVAQGVLAAGTAYALVGVAALLVVVLRHAAG